MLLNNNRNKPSVSAIFPDASVKLFLGATCPDDSFKNDCNTFEIIRSFGVSVFLLSSSVFEDAEFPLESCC